VKPAEVAAGVRGEIERNAVRVRNGIRYAAGSEWTPVSPTPKDTVWSQGKAELWRYRSDRVRFAPPVLLFIGLVSRSWVLDLHPSNSLVARLRDEGFDVYVLDWGVPDAADAANTFETYVARYLPRAIGALLRESQCRDCSILGYCMGGNLALMLAGSDVDVPIRNLVTMATPVDFHKLGGLVDSLRDGALDPDALIDSTGNVPAHVLARLFRVRKPTSDIAQYARLWENLWNDEYVSSHQAMARWASEHVPLPGALARQMTHAWVNQNGFVTGTLRLAGRRVDLRRVSVPTLCIFGGRDDLVLPDAARAVGELVGAEDLELLELDAGHAGLTASRTATRVTMPRLVEWLQRHSRTRKD
jgi:polyhydroxyalkanoate synthase